MKLEYPFSPLMWNLQLLHIYAFANGLGAYMFLSGVISMSLLKVVLGLFLFLVGLYRAYDMARYIEERWGFDVGGGGEE